MCQGCSFFSHGLHGFTRIGYGRISSKSSFPLRVYDGRCAQHKIIPACLMPNRTCRAIHLCPANLMAGQVSGAARTPATAHDEDLVAARGGAATTSATATKKTYPKQGKPAKCHAETGRKRTGDWQAHWLYGLFLFQGKTGSITLVFKYKRHELINGQSRSTCQIA